MLLSFCLLADTVFFSYFSLSVLKSFLLSLVLSLALSLFKEMNKTPLGNNSLNFKSQNKSKGTVKLSYLKMF
jgi:hypothetical protein